MQTETIPGPPGLPIIGNLADIDAETPLQSFERLTDIYGWSDFNSCRVAVAELVQVRYGNFTWQANGSS